MTNPVAKSFGHYETLQSQAALPRGVLQDSHEGKYIQIYLDAENIKKGWTEGRKLVKKTSEESFVAHLINNDLDRRVSAHLLNKKMQLAKSLVTVALRIDSEWGAAKVWQERFKKGYTFIPSVMQCKDSAPYFNDLTSLNAEKELLKPLPDPIIGASSTESTTHLESK